MSEWRAENRFASDAVTTMMRAAGLPVEEDRHNEIDGLLEAAAEAADHLDPAAARTSLVDALAEYDPAWRKGAQ